MKPTYVQPERDEQDRLLAKGTLKKGLKIGADVHRDFVMREGNTGDLLAAELDSSTNTPLNFTLQCVTRQLVRIGTYEGPFTLKMLGTLSSGDSARLREAHAELDLVGEAEQ